MGPGEMITIIGLLLAYVTALVGIYVNIKVKLKELDVKILNLSEEFNEHKIINDIANAKLEDRNAADRTIIFGKMDLMLEKIVDLRINQGIDSKAAHLAVTAAATATAAAVAAAFEQGKVKPKIR